MFVRPLPHFEWQVLRTVKRSAAPPTGKQLRLVPSRRTKDGTFLDVLVASGLLQVVGVDELPVTATAPQKRLPVQFRTRYALTEKGERAAEYGEYQYEPQKPGTAAEPPPRDKPAAKKPKGKK